MRAFIIRRLSLIVFVAIVAVLLPVSGSATLTNVDFLTPGDGLLVQDDVTAIEWLSPTFTKLKSYNDIIGGFAGLLTTHGFQYATRALTLDLINDNFSNPPAGSPGSAAGFAAASDFFAVFGVTEAVTCLTPSVPCPRTQGLTSDIGSPGTRIAVGMIQLGTSGWLIDGNPWGEPAVDGQLGHWLVRPIPEPSTGLLLALGLAGMAARRKQ